MWWGILWTQFSESLEKTHKTALWPLCVRMVQNNLRSDFSALETTRMVLRKILNIFEVCSLIRWFNKLDLTWCSPELPMLFATPKGKIEAVVKDNCVEQALWCAVSQTSLSPQHVLFVFCQNICLLLFWPFSLVLQMFHFRIKC